MSNRGVWGGGGRGVAVSGGGGFGWKSSENVIMTETLASESAIPKLKQDKHYKMQSNCR